MNNEAASLREAAKQLIQDDDYENLNPEARRLLELAAEDGDAEANHLLALALCGGVLNYYPFDNPKYEKGYAWVKAQAEAGDPKAQYQYAVIISYADGPFLEQAIDMWEKAYASGCIMAAVELGDIYAEWGLIDWGVDWLPDEEKSRYWYERAAEGGNMYSMARLEYMGYDFSVSQ